METRFRSVFNRSFCEGLYRSYAGELSRRLSTRFEFRLAETPVFVPDDLRKRLVTSACEIVGQLCEPARLSRMKAAIPAEWDTPGMDALPSFSQIDFAIVRLGDGSLAPRLIELQGFPSLTSMQVLMLDVWTETLHGIRGLEEAWSCWFGGHDRKSFIDLARATIVGGHDPETVILMDLDPPTQKTYPDFAATKLLFGVDAVCPTMLVKKGNRLWRSVEGRLVPVARIYNRVVFDELLRKRVPLPFDYRDDLDVEWASHPNWYWTWSKHSIPLLDHTAVPRAVLLSDVDVLPSDLNGYVLKPLFSFSGGGVRMSPDARMIDTIPDAERRLWCLQERVEYEPALLTPDGAGVKVEIRMMFLRPDDVQKPVLAQNLCRLSRGPMMGVDYNKDLSWVGASTGLWPS